MHNYDIVLKHSGVLGMHWGKRNAEWYPISAWKAHLRKNGKTSDKSHATENLGDRIKRKHTEKKVAKKRAANLQKAREAKAKADVVRKEKEEIIRNGDIEKALARINDFSNEELRIITERNQAKINLAKAKTDAMMSKMGTVADVTQKVSNITTNGINIYNNIAKIANAFGDADLPIINGGNNNNNNNIQSQQNSKTNQNNNQNSDKDNKAKEKEQAKRDKQIDKDIEKRMKEMDKAARKNAERQAKAEREAEKNREPEHFSGEVEGEPTYNRETYEKAAKAVKDVVVDTVWRDISNASVQRGEMYVQKALPQMNYPLLEMKK